VPLDLGFWPPGEIEAKNISRGKISDFGLKIILSQSSRDHKLMTTDNRNYNDEVE